MRAIILVVISLVVATLFVFTDLLAPLKRGAVDFSAPFYWVSGLPSKVGDWTDMRFASKARLQQENESLKIEVLVLKRKLQLNASLTAENVRLRELLNAADTLEEGVLIAELIGVSPDPTVHHVIVSRGREHGVYKGQALLDAHGLMGQVVEVGRRNSKVLLITDTSHALPVQIDRNGVRLIAEGTGSLFELRLPHVANTTDIVAGDIVVSSGLGQRFPVGYPVAEVVEVLIDPAKQFAKVVAKPMAEMNRSRHVLLVFDRPPTEG